MVSDLKEVVNYYSLGVFLKLPPSTLDHIEKYETVERRKIEVVKAWLGQSSHPCWEELVSALYEIDETVIASNIQEKHLSKSGKLYDYK